MLKTIFEAECKPSSAKLKFNQSAFKNMYSVDPFDRTNLEN